jgi:hypothetical protein
MQRANHNEDGGRGECLLKVNTRGAEVSAPRIDVTVASNESGQSAFSNRNTSISVEFSFHSTRKLTAFDD